MRKVFSIKSRNENYTADVFDNEDGSYEFDGDFDVDIDGSPDWRHDPFGQPDTTLHCGGLPINSNAVPGIVLPPECIRFVRGIVLGCHAQVKYNGRLVDAVVFDVGPHNKLGEGSAELARRLGINPDPNRGGLDTPEVNYRWWPGQAAVVDGVFYELQKYA